MDRNETFFAKALDKLGIKYLFISQRETSMDEIKNIIETAIRKWLDKYNYLFSAQEIEDLAQMTIDEMKGVDELDDCILCGDRKTLQKYDRGESPIEEHEWWVVSTALLSGVLMLECKQCDTRGTVENPTPQEWADGYHAPSTPYRWYDNDRVIVKDGD